jgi:hypothetical protein
LRPNQAQVASPMVMHQAMVWAKDADHHGASIIAFSSDVPRCECYDPQSQSIVEVWYNSTYIIYPVRISQNLKSIGVGSRIGGTRGGGVRKMATEDFVATANDANNDGANL